METAGDRILPFASPRLRALKQASPLTSREQYGLCPCSTESRIPSITWNVCCTCRFRARPQWYQVRGSRMAPTWFWCRWLVTHHLRISGVQPKCKHCPSNLPHYRRFPCCPSYRCDNKIVKSKVALMIFTIWSLKSDHCAEASWLTKSFGLHVNGTSETSWPLFTFTSGSLTYNNSCPTWLFRDSGDVCKSAENTVRYNAHVWDCYGHPKFSLINFLHIEDCTK